MSNLTVVAARVGVLILSLAMVSSLSAEDKNVTEKSPPVGFYDVASPQASSIIKRFPKLRILDIRTPKEFAAGHLKGAKNIDYFGDDFAAQIDKLDKKKGYVVHCASGGRSGKSMKLLKDKGFSTIYHIADGYKGWVAAKLPVVLK